MIKKIELAMAVILIISAVLLARNQDTIFTMAPAEEAGKGGKVCIAIDAGHGGDDPGKIGINGALERDINLTISLKLKSLLESQGYQVVMTREDGNWLGNSGNKNIKVEDMRKRCEIITEAMPMFTVSIHQNSYSEEYVKGAQVFYYGSSAQGKDIAQKIQESLVERLDPKNKRVIKANESYYLLKKTPTPTVIVECGFLSNGEEANLLITEKYQDKVAWAVMMGVVQYVNGYLTK